jgi:hypothetical protein
LNAITANEGGFVFRASLLLVVAISLACGEPSDPSSYGDGGDSGQAGEPSDSSSYGDGDDSGQTEGPSSGVVVESLVVKADGEPIGTLISVGEFGWTLDIWNPDLGIRFSVNQATGYVAHRTMYEYFEGDDCTGKVYRRELELDSTQCRALEAGPPIRRVIGADNDYFGFTGASSLLTTSGDLAWVAFRSHAFGDHCWGDSPGDEMCGSLVTTTDVIPTALPLPIEIVEE